MMLQYTNIIHSVTWSDISRCKHQILFWELLLYCMWCVLSWIIFSAPSQPWEPCSSQWQFWRVFLCMVCYTSPSVRYLTPLMVKDHHFPLHLTYSKYSVSRWHWDVYNLTRNPTESHNRGGSSSSVMDITCYYNFLSRWVLNKPFVDSSVY
jgi:hypothetical protein